jgi:hypothetical protein
VIQLDMRRDAPAQVKLLTRWDSKDGDKARLRLLYLVVQEGAALLLEQF